MTVAHLRAMFKMYGTPIFTLVVVFGIHLFKCTLIEFLDSKGTVCMFVPSHATPNRCNKTDNICLGQGCSMSLYFYFSFSIVLLISKLRFFCRSFIEYQASNKQVRIIAYLMNYLVIRAIPDFRNSFSKVSVNVSVFT